MIKAFVFGKFFPFHKGHEAMIRFALTKCDYLLVLVCSSDKENVSGEMRKRWIDTTFQDVEDIEVKVFQYNEDELPNTSVSSQDVSKVWASIFKSVFPDCNLVITSEPYGRFVAEAMNINYVDFDIDRKQIPISASKLASDLRTHWKFLPSAVRPYYIRKVIILGTESTGKTVLTEQLSRHYNCSKVSEVGRELIPSSNAFTMNDLSTVASTHAARISEAMHGDHSLIIIDTDIHITKSYARFAFGKDLMVPEDVYEMSKADLYLYLRNDVPHIQDGTRLTETARNVLDTFHRQVLVDHHITMHEISGSWAMRFDQAVSLIDALLRES